MVNCKIQIYFLVFVLTLSLGNLSFARDSVNDIGVQINGKILKLNFDFNKYFYLESPKYHFSIIEKNDNQIKYELFLKNAGAPNYLTVHYYDDAWKSKLIYLPNSKNTENQKNIHKKPLGIDSNPPPHGGKGRLVIIVTSRIPIIIVLSPKYSSNS